MMSRKRISSRAASDIAEKRMSVLLGLSEEAADGGRPDRARRYVDLARRIGRRTNTPVPRDFMFCEKCDIPLTPGRNCRVRVMDGRVKVTCLECGCIRRMPYTREQRR